MGSRTLDFLVLLVAIIAAVGCAYYIVAVLDGHRVLSRSAALAFFIFSLVVAVLFRKLL